MEKGIYLFSQYSYHDSVEEAGLLDDAEKVLQTMATKEQLLNLFEEAKLDPDLVRILRLYFNLANERTPDERPTPEGLEYLGIMCLEIYKLLTKDITESNELLLFRLFVRLNFNKDQVINYYINKLDKLMENIPENRDLLEAYLIECDYPQKKNTAYTTENHCLGKEIKGHLEVVLNHYNRDSAQTITTDNAQYKSLPALFKTNESIAVIMYLLSLFINIGVFEKFRSFKNSRIILSKLIRRKNGKEYKPDTLRSRYTYADIPTIERANTLLQNAMNRLEHDKEVAYKKRS